MALNSMRWLSPYLANLFTFRAKNIKLGSSTYVNAVSFLLTLFVVHCAYHKLTTKNGNAPRIFAYIHTMPAKHATRASAVEQTWARRLDDYVFSTLAEGLTKSWIIKFSDADHPETSRIWLWDRVKAGFRRAWEEKRHNFDWFMKADDDCYYVIENLREVLSKYDPNEPLFLAEIITREHEISGELEFYPSGGTGYILSREALRRFIAIMDDPTKCAKGPLEMEDIEIGKCFSAAGLKLIPYLGKHGSHKFIPIHVGKVLFSQLWLSWDLRGYFWWTKAAAASVTIGKNCCDENIIGMHHIEYRDMQLYDALIYGFRREL